MRNKSSVEKTGVRPRWGSQVHQLQVEEEVGVERVEEVGNERRRRESVGGLGWKGVQSLLHSGRTEKGRAEGVMEEDVWS